jgi:hypothetical protein
MRPQSRSPLVCSAAAYRPGVRLVHCVPVRGEECDHLAITWRRNFTIEWTSNQEQWPCDTGLHPTGPTFFRIRELKDEPEPFHNTRVEGDGPIKV